MPAHQPRLPDSPGERRRCYRLGEDPGELVQPFHDHVERQVGVLHNLPRVDDVGMNITLSIDRA